MNTDSVQKQIEKRILRRKRGSLFFPADFADVGSVEAVKKSLLRLAAKGLLQRVAFGIYHYPRQSPVVGPVPPTIDEIAQAIAARDKSRIVPTGDYALNALGLSTQVPMNAVYLTDGAPRRIRVGKRTILFRKSAPRNLVAKGAVSSLMLQAMKALGKDKIGKEEELKIRKLLSREKKEHLKHDMQLAPEWIKVIWRKVLNERI